MLVLHNLRALVDLPNLRVGRLLLLAILTDSYILHSSLGIVEGMAHLLATLVVQIHVQFLPTFLVAMEDLLAILEVQGRYPLLLLAILVAMA
jgi:hypothetical protein